MVRDYSERRQIRSKPPAKRPSIWPQILLILVLLLFAFLAGVATGRHLYKPGGRFNKAPLTPPAPAAAKQGAALPSQGQPVTPATPHNSVQPAAQQVQDGTAGQPGSTAPQLTFYNTLQKGNKGLIGTGINQPKEGQQPAPPKAAAPQPAER